MKLAVIASPKSGANRRNPRRLAALKDRTLAAGARFEAPMGLDRLTATVTSLAEDGVDLIAVNGGDGTVHRVLTAVVAAYGEDLPTLAILPGGTMNIAARSTGWLGAPLPALERVLAHPHNPSLAVTRRWLMAIDGQHYGFLFGNGLLASFLEVYEEAADPTVFRAASILGRGALSAMVSGPFAKQLTRRWQGTVELDGVVLPRTDWLAVAAGTVEQIGLGFRPFRMVQSHPGSMHAVGLGCSVARFARELPRVYRRRPLGSEDNLEKPAQRMVLRSEEPASFMVDGDFHRGGNTLVVEVGPAVDVLVPPSAPR